LFDSQLTAFYQRVTTAIRAADPTTTVWIEPNLLFSNFDATHLGAVHDAHIGWAFHDYCGTASIGLGNTLCSTLDQLTISSAKVYSTSHRVPWLMTEFGATNDLTNLSEMVTLADKNRLGWLEWAYTGNDKTSTSPNGQALILDPTQPPTGANVVTSKLKVLAEPYPQAVAGTPTSWSFSGGVFTLTYSTARASGVGRFPAGSQTDIAVPAIQYPAGYSVTVAGGSVMSAPGATTLQVSSSVGALTVTVTVTVRPAP
jgi:endoglycosylceramidase